MLPIVIPAYKNKQQLDKCIGHLNTQGMPIEIFVRDNSNDNIYFTAAVNEGIKHFLSIPDWSYIVIINQDFYLERDALHMMVLFMESHPKCGIGMPLQLSNENPQLVIFGGGCQAWPIGMATLGGVLKFREDEEITWADAGCLILRKEMIQEIGLFDENLKFVGSDSDYCFTARSRGWQVWQIGKAKGIHEKGSSATPHCGHELNLIKCEDMLYYAKKWLTGGLYKELAHEGVNLEKEHVDKEIAHLEKTKIQLEEVLKL